MSNKSGITLNTKEFDKKFFKIVNKAIPEEAQKGQFNAASELLLDADRVVPKTPFLKGDLKGSKKVEVKVTSGKIETQAGFDIEYARRVHELGVKKEGDTSEPENINWTTPGTGAKFLQSKMPMFKNKYMKIIAETIKQSAK